MRCIPFIIVLMIAMPPAFAQKQLKQAQTFHDWVDDCYSVSYKGLPADASAFKTPVRMDTANKFGWMLIKSGCAFHIVRNGCAADSPGLLRSAFRNWGGVPGAMNPDLSRTAGGGFRVARTLQGKSKN